MTKYFMGSAVDTSIGIGNLCVGTEARRTNEGYEILCEGKWIDVFDIMIVHGFESPMEEDLSPARV